MATAKRKERNRLNRESGSEELLRLGKKRKFKVEELNSFQFRVNGAIDFYPTNRRYHVLKTGERGSYDNPLKLLRRMRL